MAKPLVASWNGAGVGAANCGGYWPLCEGTGGTTEDVSPAGNDATITGATWGSGALGPFLAFDADTDYAQAHAGAMGSTSGWNLSLAAQVSFADDTTDGYFNFHGSNAGDQFVTLHKTGSRVAYILYDGSSNPVAMSPFVTITPGTTYTIQGVSYANNDHRLYVNGVEVAASTTTVGTFTVNRLNFTQIERGTLQGAGLRGDLYVNAWWKGGYPAPADLSSDWQGGVYSAVAGGGSIAPAAAMHHYRMRRA